MDESHGPSPIEAAEQARVDALLRADVSAVEAMLADDLTYVHATGRVEGKRELLAGLRSGTRYLSVVQNGLIARMLEGAGVLTGGARLTLQRAGSPEPLSLATNFTQVWVRRSGSWLLLAHHASLDR